MWSMIKSKGGTEPQSSAICNTRSHPIKSGSLRPAALTHNPLRGRGGRVEEKRRSASHNECSSDIWCTDSTFAELDRNLTKENPWKHLNRNETQDSSVTLFTTQHKQTAVCVSVCHFSAVKVTPWFGLKSALSMCSSDPNRASVLHSCVHLVLTFVSSSF